MAYLGLKFGNVKAECEGVMDDNVAKKRLKILVTPTGKPTNRMALKFFPEIILLLKVARFEGIVNRSKIDRMVNDHSSRCNL